MREWKNCEICGKEFLSRDRRQRTCGSKECKYALHKQTQREYERSHPKRNSERYKKLKIEETKRVKRPIIGKGYAERQIADSLRLAGRVNTEL